MKTFLANLKRAVRDRETVSLGGGLFNHRELFVITEKLERITTAAPGEQLAQRIYQAALDGEPQISLPTSAVLAMLQAVTLDV